MSNSRLAAIGWMLGFVLATLGNLTLASDGSRIGLITDLVRCFFFGSLLAAAAVAFLGDRK